MRNIVLGAAALAAAAITLPLTAVRPANAVEYPYCATGTWGSGGCNYATLEQCRAFISGAGGFCVSNPRYTQGGGDVARTPRTRPRPRR
jgi:hypothetical protein